jgi:hypothetical protein
MKAERAINCEADDVDQHRHLWDEFVAPLGEKYLRQFRSAAANDQSAFFSRVIRPQLFTGSTYMSVEDNIYVKDRDHRNAQKMAATGAQTADWQACSYFTNAMLVDPFPNPLTPSERSIMGNLTVFTFEFDRDEVEFLKEQLDWLPKVSRWRKSPMGLLYEHCSQYADFDGICVAWSGNKSLHTHVVFKGGMYEKAHGELDYPNRGLQAHWEALADDVIRILAPSQRVGEARVLEPTKPDDALKNPIQYRRLPGAVRRLTKPNVLGMPVGTMVPQVVLWEEYRDRAKRGATALFFSPSLFAKAESQKARQPSVRASSIGRRLRDDEIAAVERVLREFYPGPDRAIFHSLSFDAARNEYVAHFQNDPGDRNPTSVMIESHRAIKGHGVGKDALSDHRHLPFTLGQLIEYTCQRLDREKAVESRISEEWVDEDGEWNRRDEELSDRRCGQAFAAAFSSTVVDTASAQAVMREHMPILIATEGISLVSGPEGCGKTTSLFHDHARIMTSLNAQGFHGLAAYAFADYVNAIEKVASFNQINSGGKYHAILWPGFSHAYRSACKKLNLTPISDEDVRRSGYESMWKLVKRSQPAVLKLFRKQHDAMWAEIGDREPVIFTMHAVVHEWQLGRHSRTMWAKSFWNEAEERSTHLRETELALLVHDEVKWSTFTDVINEEAYDWLNNLPSDLKEAHRQNYYSRFRQEMDSHVEEVAWPNGEEIRADDVARYLPLVGWKPVTTADTGEYLLRNGNDAEQDIYHQRHGRKWFARSRRWWRDNFVPVANRIVFLTTESVPVAIAEKAHPNIYVIELTADKMERHTIETWPEKSVKSKKLAERCRAAIAELKLETGEEWFAISNVAKGVATTHATARGANSFIGKNVVQTCTFMAVEDYELHQALNAWSGRDDLVSKRHVDEINQTAGRNLGFRYRLGVRHILLINLTLYTNFLITKGLAGLRYEIAEQATNQTRKNQRRGGPSAVLPCRTDK